MDTKKKRLAIVFVIKCWILQTLRIKQKLKRYCTSCRTGPDLNKQIQHYNFSVSFELFFYNRVIPFHYINSFSINIFD